MESYAMSLMAVTLTCVLATTTLTLAVLWYLARLRPERIRR